MELPPIIGGKYRVLRELARGGMGVVYVVEHQGTGEELALKLMSDRLLASPQAVERFKREARAPTRIRSDHVVRVIDADTAPELGGAPFLVMELLEGDDLERLGEKAPSTSTVIEWLRQAARALDRAHALGFVHRDLKPANLFLARRPEGAPIVKVLDFGIVKMLEDSGATESGATLGTPRYMSPEQVLAERGTVGPAADVWAMGLVAFRLLTGVEYWRAETTIMLISAILHGAMPSPSERGCDLGPAFDAWFLRSCSREPGARFASVGEQIDALAKALEGQPEPLRRASSPHESIGHASTTPLEPPQASGPSLDPKAAAIRAAAEPSETVLAMPAPRTDGSGSGQRAADSRGRRRLPLVAGGAALFVGAVAWWAIVGRTSAPQPAAPHPSPPATEASRPPPEKVREAAIEPTVAPERSAVAARLTPPSASASGPPGAKVRPAPHPAPAKRAPAAAPSKPESDPLGDPL